MDGHIKGITILGSTGSVGTQAIEVVKQFPDKLKIIGLAAKSSHAKLFQQIQEISPLMASWDKTQNSKTDMTQYQNLYSEIPDMCTNKNVDIVLTATTGITAIHPTIQAIKSGKNIALANKESIIIAGEQIISEAKKHSVEILPVDSEPNAIWQCIQGEKSEINRVFITSSGGSLRSKNLDTLGNSTIEETMKHPNWAMGPKITVDSATLMNKVFEVIEAKWLFDIPWEKIDVIVHNQSKIHSMVEFVDGSIKAQIGPSDMKSPIQYALLYPDRFKNPSINQFNPLENKNLTFEEIDPRRYPCFELGIETAKKGNTWPAVLCGADEGAVELFLRGKIKFSGIFTILNQVIKNHIPIQSPSLSDMMATFQNSYTEAINSKV